MSQNYCSVQFALSKITNNRYDMLKVDVMKLSSRAEK